MRALTSELTSQLTVFSRSSTGMDVGLTEIPDRSTNRSLQPVVHPTGDDLTNLENNMCFRIHSAYAKSLKSSCVLRNGFETSLSHNNVFAVDLMSTSC